jgi:hypothetical protein
MIIFFYSGSYTQKSQSLQELKSAQTKEMAEDRKQYIKFLQYMNNNNK